MTKSTIDLDYLRQINALIRLQNREYLTHPGLLRVAHEHGLKSITCDLISWDAEKQSAVIRCQVDGERGTYTSYGDASPANVGRQVAGACLRMAETRAINRALRLYTGLGMTTTEELPGGGEPAMPSEELAQGAAVQPAPEAKPEPPTRRRKKKETPEEEAARKAGHDADWATDRSAFMAALGRTGLQYEDLCAWCKAHGRPRPSAMTRQQRSDLSAWLPRNGAERIGAWLRENPQPQPDEVF